MSKPAPTPTEKFIRKLDLSDIQNSLREYLEGLRSGLRRPQQEAINHLLIREVFQKKNLNNFSPKNISSYLKEVNEAVNRFAASHPGEVNIAEDLLRFINREYNVNLVLDIQEGIQQNDIRFVTEKIIEKIQTAVPLLDIQKKELRTKVIQYLGSRKLSLQKIKQLKEEVIADLDAITKFFSEEEMQEIFRQDEGIDQTVNKLTEEIRQILDNFPSN